MCNPCKLSGTKAKKCNSIHNVILSLIYCKMKRWLGAYSISDFLINLHLKNKWLIHFSNITMIFRPNFNSLFRSWLCNKQFTVAKWGINIVEEPEVSSYLSQQIYLRAGLFDMKWTDYLVRLWTAQIPDFWLETLTETQPTVKMMRRRHSFQPSMLSSSSLLSPTSPTPSLLSPDFQPALHDMQARERSKSPAPNLSMRCKSPIPIGRCKSPGPLGRCKSPAPLVRTIQSMTLFTLDRWR